MLNSSFFVKKFLLNIKGEPPLAKSETCFFLSCNLLLGRKGEPPASCGDWQGLLFTRLSSPRSLSYSSSHLCFSLSSFVALLWTCCGASFFFQWGIQKNTVFKMWSYQGPVHTLDFNCILDLAGHILWYKLGYSWPPGNTAGIMFRQPCLAHMWLSGRFQVCCRWCFHYSHQRALTSRPT